MTYTYDYPKADLTVDIVVFNPEGTRVLLIRRKNEPFKHCWALPGGYVDIAKGETTRRAAQRELQEETDLIPERLHELRVFDDPDRDPRGRVISVAFWCQLRTPQRAVAGDDAAECQWFELSGLLTGTSCVELAFDHYNILLEADKRLSWKEAFK